MYEGRRPVDLILFLNALAFGAVAPLLYYIIVLPDSIWIGLLFCVQAAGRIVGGPLLEKLQQHVGLKGSLIITQLMAVLSYAFLSTAGHFQTKPIHAIEAVYLARFFGSLATANFPSVQSLFHRTSPALWSTRSSLLTMMGFAAGCALAMPGNNYPVLISVFQTGGLTRSAEYAAVISCLTVMIAVLWRVPTATSEPALSQSSAQRCGSIAAPVITLLCDAAFGMTLCVAPLLARETYFFTPANIAALLGGAALLSQAAQSTIRLGRETRYSLQLILMNLGFLCAALGFLGFTTALKLSWVLSWHSHPLNGMKVGYWLIWISAIPAGIGHGLLRASLPALFSRPGETSRRPHVTLRFDQLSALVSCVFALFASSIWLAHERSSLAIPCLLIALAIPLGAYCFLITLRNQSGICQAHGVT